MSAPGAARLRALVVDDESLARERLQRLLERAPDVEVVGTCASGTAAVREVLARHPDVLFLDVQMPGLDGFGVLRALRAEVEAGGAAPPALPLVVFVTAFDEHALRAFEVHAVDYVLKPLDPDRLTDALARVRARHAQADAARRWRELLRVLDQAGDAAPGRAELPALEASLQPAPADPVPNALPGAVAAPPRPLERIVVKSQERYYFVRPADIDYVEAAANYAKLHVGKQTHLIRETMARLEETLDPARFVRIHRSTIVNLDRVKVMEPWFSGEYLVVLHDGTQLRMSRWYRDRVLGAVGAPRAGAESPVAAEG